MGDSSACLVRSFSHPASPNSSGDKQGMNCIKRALTSSISFGRFMSESLDWEKFSVFNQKRYLEEVERCSKPGSVAEKRAYFEAHYKRKRAAALLEQQNAESSDALPERNVTAKVGDSSLADSGLAQEGCFMDIDRTKEVADDSYTVVSVGQRDNCEAVIERELGESNLRAEQVDEPLVLMEIPVESMNIVENNGSVVDVANQDDKASKDAYTTRVSAPSVERPPVPSSKLLKNDTAIKRVPPPPPPIRPRTPVLTVIKEKATTNKLNKARDSVISKKGSISTTLHMSINCASSCFGEMKKTTCPSLPKSANSTVIRTPLKKTNNSLLPPTLTRASANVLINAASESRAVKPNGHSTSGNRITDGKALSTTSYSKSSNTVGNKPQSTTVSSSFTFKSEERAAKRKEFFQKLEEKWKSNESEKPPNTKPQVKARNSLKDHLEAAKNSAVPLKTDPSSNTAKKVLNVIPCSPNIKQRSAAFRVQENEPRPPWRFSTKADSLKDAAVRTNRPPIHNGKSFPKRSLSENSSPNGKSFQKRSMCENSSPNVQI